MQAMAGTGVTWFPDGDLENFVREAARLPKLDKDQVEMRRMLQLRSEATEFATANTEYLMAQNNQAMAAAGQDPMQAQGATGQQQESGKDEKPGRSQ